jgi:type IV secretion system protein VirD4
MGLVLYLIHEEKTEQDKENTTLAAILNMTTPIGQSFKEWILKTIEEHEKMDDALSSECVSALLSYAGNASDNTAAGILSSMTAPLNVFRDPLVAKATSANDFDLLQLRQKKMSIYIKLTPHNIAKFSVLVNLLFSQIINLNVEQGLPEHNKNLKYQCLLMLDEFTSLGYMGIIETAIAYIAGYNIRLCLILQDRVQLDKNYKQSKDTLMNNCAVKIIYTPSENDSAKYYSEMLGYETVKGKSKSRSRGKSGSTSQSESDQKRALMMPQELLQMPFEQALVWLKGTKIINADKVMYFKDPSFQKRVSWAVPEITSLFEPDNKPEPEPEEALDALDQDIATTIRLAAIEQNAREQREREALLAGAFDDLEGADTADFKANLEAALSDNTVTTYLQKMHNFTDNSDDNTADNNQTNKETAS